MVSQIVTDVHLLNFAIFVLHFQKDVLEEVVVMLLHFYVGNGVGHFRRSCGILGVAVAILKHDGLREGGFVVQSGACGSVTASSDFDVERTVDFVLFRPKN